MNHRGSLAYYPAAVVCGSFFLAVCYYPYLLFAAQIPTGAWARGFLFVCFFTLLMAVVPLLLWAALLRWLVRRQKWTGTMEWMAAGVSLFAVVEGAFGIALKYLTPISWSRGMGLLLAFVFGGSRFALSLPLWLPLPAAVATTYVLLLVHRAFEPRADAPADAAQTS